MQPNDEQRITNEEEACVLQEWCLITYKAAIWSPLSCLNVGRPQHNVLHLLHPSFLFLDLFFFPDFEGYTA